MQKVRPSARPSPVLRPLSPLWPNYKLCFGTYIFLFVYLFIWGPPHFLRKAFSTLPVKGGCFLVLFFFTLGGSSSSSSSCSPSALHIQGAGGGMPQPEMANLIAFAKPAKLDLKTFQNIPHFGMIGLARHGQVCPGLPWPGKSSYTLGCFAWAVGWASKGHPSSHTGGEKKKGAFFLHPHGNGVMDPPLSHGIHGSHSHSWGTSTCSQNSFTKA